MPRRSREEVEQRLEAVERALLELPWTVATQKAIGTEYGVGARQIREDAQKVRARWAKEAKGNTSDEHRADWLQRVRAAQSHAMGQNQSIALSRLLQLEARCMGFESPLEVRVSHTVEAMSPRIKLEPSWTATRTRGGTSRRSQGPHKLSRRASSLWTPRRTWKASEVNLARIEAGAAGALAWSEGRERNPLAYAVPWHNEHPRTSQRAPLQNPGEDVTVVLGGNGAGKSVLGAMWSACHALGSNDPSARAFMRASGMRPDLVPPEGGNVLAVSLNASLSIHVQRAELRKYLPPSTVWRNPRGPGSSVAELPNGRKIVFLTNDSGRRAAQGFGGIGMVWIDEEGDEDVFNELLARVFR